MGSDLSEYEGNFDSSGTVVHWQMQDTKGHVQ